MPGPFPCPPPLCAGTVDANCAGRVQSLRAACIPMTTPSNTPPTYATVDIPFAMLGLFFAV
eukprot:5505719-Pyramimonas_sp.AAC.2